MNSKVHLARKYPDTYEWYEWICSANSVQYGDIRTIDETDPRSTQDAEKVTCKHCLRVLPQYLKERLTR